MSDLELDQQPINKEWLDWIYLHTKGADIIDKHDMRRLVNAADKGLELQADRDEWKRRALEAEEAGRAILEWEGANCDGYADKVSDDCPFCKMRAVLNSINSGKNDTV